MDKKKNRQFNNKAVKLIATALLGFVVSVPVFADCFFFDPIDEIVSTPPKSIYLDSSQVVHPFININKAPSPSEYAKQKSTQESVYKPDKNTDELIPVNDLYKQINDSFAPPSEDDELTPPPTPDILAVPTVTQKTAESSYTASVEESQNTAYDEPELEGKIIKNIKFSGLNLISEEQVYSYIQTKNGSVFNSSRLQKDLQSIFQSGYFTDSMHVDPTLNNDDTVELEFVLKENIEVTNISFKGNTVFSEAELMQFVKPLKNKPQNLLLINEAIENINTHYHEKGYILEGITSVDDNSDGVLTLYINEGIVEKIVYEGNNRTKDFVIQRNILTQPGSVYNEEQFKKDLTRVYATQIFDDVDRIIEPSPDKEGEYIVTVKVKESSSNSVSIGAGVDSALGLFGSLSAKENNFLGRAQKLSLSGIIGSGVLLSDASMKERMNYQVELSFLEPHFINADNSLEAKIYYRDLGSFQVPLAIERRFGFGTSIRHKVKGYDNLTTTLGTGFEHISLKEGDFGKIATLYAQRGINFALREKQLTGGNYININPGVQYSTLDNEFMPRDGTVAKVNFIESLGIDDFKNTTGRLAGSVTQYIPVFEKSTLSIGAKGGIKVHGDKMPEVMAFGLGGPYTVRGYRMNGVGTGNAFVMGSAELQTPIPFMDRFKYDILKNLRFAFFMDAGKVFDPTISAKLYDRPLNAIAVGVGLRVNIPGMGPIAVDYGLPLTHVGAYNSKKGYITFGTPGMFDNY